VVRGFAKGWSEEKRLVALKSLARLYPAVAAEGDNVFAAYVDGALKLLVSRDAGKTWAPPVVLSGNLEINSSPAIATLGTKVVVVWPSMVETQNTLSLQLHAVHSADGGKTWSAPRRVTQNIDDCLSPRLLPLRTGLLVVWQQTPVESTLGGVSLRERADWSPDSIEPGVHKFEVGSIERGGPNVRVAVESCLYSQEDNAFTPPSRIQEIFAKQRPNVFQVYGPESGNLFLTFNIDTDIRTLASKDNGRTWTPHFAGTGYFDSRTLLNVISTSEGRRAVWIRRDPYQPLAINFRDTPDGPPQILTPPYSVRATPHLAVSNQVYHVVWSAGQGENSWISYMRTDTIRPTTRITAPDSPRITGPMIRFEWAGNDNISDTAQLTYSQTYGDHPWSRFDEATFAEIVTPPDGEYTFRVRAMDVAGNIQEPPAEFKFDTFGAAPGTEILGIRLQPTVTLLSEAFGATAPTINQRNCRVLFSGKDNTERADQLMYSVQLDGGNWSEFTSERSHEFQQLANGRHTLRARAKDSRGNIDATPAEVSVVVQVNIEVRFVTTPPEFAKEDPITISWEGLDASGDKVAFSYYCRLDDGQPKALGQDTQISLQELEEKQHTFTVYAVDPAGNRTAEQSCSFTVDRTPPETLAHFEYRWSPSGGFPIVTLEGSDPPVGDATEGRPVRLFQYHLGDGQWEDTSLPGGRDWVVSRSLPFYSWGYKATVRAVDSAGNADPTPTVVDLTLPHRHTPTTCAIAGGLVGVILLTVLWLMMRRRTRRRPLIPAPSTLDTYSGITQEIPSEGGSDEKRDNPFGS
jgi:hypothetical protein